jgi:hypothetical protein
MNKNIFYATFAAIFVFCVTLAYAQQETNKIMEELNKELEQEKVFLPKELKDLDRSLRNSMEHGVNKEDLKTILSDLKKKEVDPKEIKKTIDSMNDLIKAGVEPGKAGNIVSQAAHLARAQGLKGTALTARVHEAIQTRKAEREKLEQHKHQKEIQAPEIFKVKEREKESHSRGHGKGKR